MFVTTSNLVETAGWVDHTHQTLAGLDELRATIASAKSSALGYVLTGDEERRRSNADAIEQLRGTQRQLRELVADNPAQLERLDRLAPLLSERVRDMSDLIALRLRSGDQLPTTPLIAKVAAPDLRTKNLLTALADEEQRLLHERQQRSFARLVMARATQIAGMLISFALLLTVFRALRRAGERRRLSELAARESENRLAAAHEKLEHRVAERTAELLTANLELQREIAERHRATEALKRSEEQFRQAQKMEAVGRLAGGVAHDFNNVLSVILSYSDLLSRGLPEGDPTRVDLQEIHKAGERAAALTRQLLAFSRQQVLDPRIVDLNEILAGMGKLLDRVLGEDVVLRTRTVPELERVKLDPGQIEQVILNLVVNSRDAMPQGGELVLETANVELDDAYAASHPGVSPGPHVMLAVRDTGSGMSEETQTRAFEPFFTTKEKGKGTGLGLSTVLGIVEQSGGSFALQSAPGEGTTFRLYFPVASSAEDPRRSGSAQPETPGGAETILLVEDEAPVRSLIRSLLSKSGYHVLEARDGEEALLLGERFSGQIHLVLTDVVMPKMGGPELAERLARVRPQARVLFMSGYTDDTVVHHGVLRSGMAFLQKPITPAALARKVREVLDGPERGRLAADLGSLARA